MWTILFSYSGVLMTRQGEQVNLKISMRRDKKVQQPSLGSRWISWRNLGQLYGPQWGRWESFTSHLDVPFPKLDSWGREGGRETWAETTFLVCTVLGLMTESQSSYKEIKLYCLFTLGSELWLIPFILVIISIDFINIFKWRKTWDS